MPRGAWADVPPQFPTASGGDVLIGPGARPDALIERVRREVRATRPDDGPDLGIDGDACEARRRAGVVEDGSAHAVEDIDVALEAVGEREAKHAVAQDLGGGDVRRES